MFDITISKLDETHLKINAEECTLYELKDAFTFYAENFKWHPKFKAKLWDGKIHLLKMPNRNTGIIYYGLLDQIKEFAKSRNYSLQIDLQTPYSFKLEEIEKFIEKEKTILPKGLILRDYQEFAIKSCLLNNRQLILSPTSSGKSLILYLINKFLLINNFGGIIIVPTVMLVNQLESDFLEYSNENWNVSNYIHKIYSGKEKNSSKQLLISTWQSLHEIKNKAYFEQFNFVFVDEVHTAKAASLTSILEKCNKASIRLGFTGTLDGLKVNEKTLIGLFGPIKKLITTKELITRKQIADFQIKCVILNYDQETKKLLRRAKYQDEIKFIINNKKRNNFIINLALSQNRNSIILFNYVETHGKVLYDLLLNSPKRNGRNIYFIHGGIQTDEREKIRKIMEEEKDAIIVASFGTMATGVSIKNLHNLIFAISGKAKIKTLQSIGRILRLQGEGKKATLFDLVDDFSIGKSSNFTLQHFIERVKIYDNEKFEYKIINVNF